MMEDIAKINYISAKPKEFERMVESKNWKSVMASAPSVITKLEKMCQDPLQRENGDLHKALQKVNIYFMMYEIEF